MLSGHTHGGQGWFPLIGSPFLAGVTRYGTKYARGLVQGPTTRVFISTGLGITGLPFRFCVPPELAILTLVPAT